MLRDERGVAAVLVKGGHWGDAEAIDVLVAPAGVDAELAGPRIAGASVHGTGCALSTAIACELARGAALADACRAAKAFVRRAIAAPARPGRGRAAIV